MFGVEFEFECFCGDSTKADLTRNSPKKSDSECDMPCPGDGVLSCGGCEQPLSGCDVPHALAYG